MFVIVIAVIDHGTSAIQAPTSHNVLMTAIYLFGLFGGIWAWRYPDM